MWTHLLNLITGVGKGIVKGVIARSSRTILKGVEINISVMFKFAHMFGTLVAPTLVFQITW